MIESVKSGSAVEYSGRAAALTVSAITNQEESEAYEVSISSGSGSKLNTSQISAIKQHVESTNDSLRSLIAKMLLKQSGVYVASLSGQGGMTPAEAQEAISEDGYWGADAVSDRIVSFAMTVSGNDTSKLAELKEAINKGFERAGMAFGGSLPGICAETYNAVMDKLDKWAESGGVDTEA